MAAPVAAAVACLISVVDGIFAGYDVIDNAISKRFDARSAAKLGIDLAKLMQEPCLPMDPSGESRILASLYDIIGLLEQFNGIGMPVKGEQFTEGASRFFSDTFSIGGQDHVYGILQRASRQGGWTGDGAELYYTLNSQLMAAFNGSNPLVEADQKMAAIVKRQAAQVMVVAAALAGCRTSLVAAIQLAHNLRMKYIAASALSSPGAIGIRNSIYALVTGTAVSVLGTATGFLVKQRLERDANIADIGLAKGIYAKVAEAANSVEPKGSEGDPAPPQISAAHRPAGLGASGAVPGSTGADLRGAMGGSRGGSTRLAADGTEQTQPSEQAAQYARQSSAVPAAQPSAAYGKAAPAKPDHAKPEPAKQEPAKPEPATQSRAKQEPTESAGASGDTQRVPVDVITADAEAAPNPLRSKALDG